jgi:hypothetical protein
MSERSNGVAGAGLRRGVSSIGEIPRGGMPLTPEARRCHVDRVIAGMRVWALASVWVTMGGCHAARAPETTLPAPLAEELEVRAESFVERQRPSRTEGSIDSAEAVREHERACEAGQPMACYELAVLVYLGRGVEVDDARAARLHREACEGGIPQGCAHLAHLHARGLGVDQSRERSTYYRGLACELGYVDMCRRVGGPARTDDTWPQTSDADSRR